MKDEKGEEYFGVALEAMTTVHSSKKNIYLIDKLTKYLSAKLV